MGRKLVAIIDWRAASSLKNNAALRERGGGIKQRSLILWNDGSVELQRFSTAAVARRLGAVAAQVTRKGAETGRRG